MKRVLLIYHKPGRRGEEARVERLAAKIETMTAGGIKAEYLTIEEVDETAGERFDVIYMLMFTRGGHWVNIIETTGRIPRLIPQYLAASVVAGEARASAANRILVLGLQARRAEHLQLEDLQLLQLLLSSWGLVATYRLLDTVKSRPSINSKWCNPNTLIAPLALLDGDLAARAREAAEACRAKAMKPFLHLAEPLIASWIVCETIRNQCRNL